jgi:hypothetical protein
MQEERDYEEKANHEIPVRNITPEPKKESMSRREIELYIALFCIGIAYLLLIDVVL